MLSRTGEFRQTRGFKVGDYRFFRSPIALLIAIKLDKSGDDDWDAPYLRGDDAELELSRLKTWGYPYEGPRQPDGSWSVYEFAPDWHYLIEMPNHDVLKCPGNEYVALKHLKAIREELNCSPTARLIGVYPPNSIGGPDGVGGVYSYGFTPTHEGKIGQSVDEWTKL